MEVSSSRSKQEDGTVPEPVLFFKVEVQDDYEESACLENISCSSIDSSSACCKIEDSSEVESALHSELDIKEETFDTVFLQQTKLPTLHSTDEPDPLFIDSLRNIADEENSYTEEVSSLSQQFSAPLSTDEASMPNNLSKSPDRQEKRKKKVKFCPYCYQFVYFFARHLVSYHPTEPEVIKFMSNEENDPKEKMRKNNFILSKILDRGKSVYYSSIMKEISDEKFSRKNIGETKTFTYVKCNYCHTSLHRDHAASHRKTCVKKSKMPRKSLEYDQTTAECSITSNLTLDSRTTLQTPSPLKTVELSKDPSEVTNCAEDRKNPSPISKNIKNKLEQHSPLKKSPFQPLKTSKTVGPHEKSEEKKLVRKRGTFSRASGCHEKISKFCTSEMLDVILSVNPQENLKLSVNEDRCGKADDLLKVSSTSDESCSMNAAKVPNNFFFETVPKIDEIRDQKSNEKNCRYQTEKLTDVSVNFEETSQLSTSKPPSCDSPPTSENTQLIEINLLYDKNLEQSEKPPLCRSRETARTLQLETGKVLKTCPSKSLKIALHFSEVPPEIYSSFEKEILNKMKNNLLSFIAKKDPLISMYGAVSFQSADETDHKQIIKRMTDLASLFIVMEEQRNSILSFEDCFKPSNFELMKEALQFLRECIVEQGKSSVSEIPVWYRIALEICLCILKVKISKSGVLTEVQKEEAYESVEMFSHLLKDFKKFSSNENCGEVQFESNLQYLKSLSIDSTNVTSILEDSYSPLILDLKANPSMQSFETLCKLIIADIVLLNRRRREEVARITLEQYLTTKKKERNYVLNKDKLTETEKKVADFISVFYISGKNCDNVPLFLTCNMKEGIECLIEHRSLLNIPSEGSNLLFPKPSSSAVFDECLILEEIGKKCSVLNPFFFTCPGLRLQAAVECQVLGKKTLFLEKLAESMDYLTPEKSEDQSPLSFIHNAVIGNCFLLLRTRSLDKQCVFSFPVREPLSTLDCSSSFAVNSNHAFVSNSSLTSQTPKVFSNGQKFSRVGISLDGDDAFINLLNKISASSDSQAVEKIEFPDTRFLSETSSKFPNSDNRLKNGISFKYHQNPRPSLESAEDLNILQSEVGNIVFPAAFAKTFKSCVKIGEKYHDLNPAELCMVKFDVGDLQVEHNFKSMRAEVDSHNEELNSFLSDWKLKIPSVVFQSFQETVLSQMRNDLISVIAKSDKLICTFGAVLFSSYFKDCNFIISRMTELAYLFIMMEEQSDTILTFEDCLKSSNFKILFEAFLSLGMYRNEPRIVGTSHSFSDSLKTCANILFVKSQSKDVFSSEVSEMQRNVLQFIRLLHENRKFFSSEKLPKYFPQSSSIKVSLRSLSIDLSKISSLVETSYPPLMEDLKTNPSIQSFEALCKLIISDIIIFNKRRRGEVVKATLKQYSVVNNDRKNYILDEDILTEEEKDSAKILSVFHIEGKNNKNLPILLTSIMKSGIECLIQHRSLLNIPSEGTDLLFPIPNSSRLFDESSIISEIREKYSIKNPYFTCPGLRLHQAYVSKVRHEKSFLPEKLAEFMGLSLNLNQNNDDLSLELVHQAVVGNRLLLFRDRTVYKRNEISFFGCFPENSSDSSSSYLQDAYDAFSPVESGDSNSNDISSSPSSTKKLKTPCKDPNSGKIEVTSENYHSPFNFLNNTTGETLGNSQKLSKSSKCLDTASGHQTSEQSNFENSDCVQTVKYNFKSKKILSSVHQSNSEVSCQIYGNKSEKKKEFSKTLSQLCQTPLSLDISQSFFENILSKMKNDLISVIAKSDELLRIFGAVIFNCSSKSTQCNNYVSSRMMELAHLFVMMEGLSDSILTFEDCLKPSNLDLMIEALQNLGKYTEDKKDPSTASIPMQYLRSLKTCANILLLKRKSKNQTTDSKVSEASETVEKFLSSLYEKKKFAVRKKFSKQCPQINSVKSGLRHISINLSSITTKIEESYPSLIESLKTETSDASFQALSKLIIADIVLLNRRRRGEITKATLEEYSKMKEEERNFVLNGGKLSADEKDSAEILSIFYVSGKNNENLPILLTSIMKNGIECLMEHRSALNIPSEKSDLLFPKPNSSEIFDESVIIAEIREKFLPENFFFTCPGLRLHLTTTYQVCDEKSSLPKKLAKFMNYSLDLKDDNSEIPLSLIYKGIVGNRVLLFRNRKLYKRSAISISTSCLKNLLPNVDSSLSNINNASVNNNSRSMESENSFDSDSLVCESKAPSCDQSSVKAGLSACDNITQTKSVIKKKIVREIKKRISSSKSSDEAKSSSKICEDFSFLNFKIHITEQYPKTFSPHNLSESSLEMSQAFQENILGKMRNDLISFIAKSDKLICTFGVVIFNISSESIKISDRIPVRMRELAILFIMMEELSDSILTFEDCLEPSNFDVMIEAFLNIGEYVKDKKEPSIARIPTRYLQSLKICADILILKNRPIGTPADPEVSEKSASIIKFVQLLDEKGTFSNHGKFTNGCSLNSSVKVGLRQLSIDYYPITIKVEESYPSLMEDLKVKPSVVSFEALSKHIIADIILLNRRRKGEIAEATLEEYLKMKEGERNYVLNKDALTEEEKDSVEILSLFYVSGSNNKNLPVLLTSIMKDGIECLIEHRSTLNIPSEKSDLLFPKPNSSEVFDEYSIITEIREKYCIKNPLFTCSGLRLHLANVYQVRDEKSSLPEQISKFMSYSFDVKNDCGLPTCLVYEGIVGNRLLLFRNRKSYKRNKISFSFCSSDNSALSSSSKSFASNENDKVDHTNLETNGVFNMSDKSSSCRPDCLNPEVGNIDSDAGALKEFLESSEITMLIDEVVPILFENTSEADDTQTKKVKTCAPETMSKTNTSEADDTQTKKVKTCAPETMSKTNTSEADDTQTKKVKTCAPETMSKTVNLVSNSNCRATSTNFSESCRLDCASGTEVRQDSAPVTSAPSMNSNEGLDSSESDCKCPEDSSSTAGKQQTVENTFPLTNDVDSMNVDNNFDSLTLDKKNPKRSRKKSWTAKTPENICEDSNKDGDEDPVAKKKIKRTPWTVKQRKIIWNYFGSDIENKVNPKREAISKVYFAEPELQSKSLPSVFTYVNNYVMGKANLDHLKISID